MKTKLTLFVDESGEAGVSKIRTGNQGGASPYMTLGGVLIRTVDATVLERRVKEISQLFSKKELHCADLKHEQKVYFSRQFSKLKLGAFGVVSKKTTLGSYKTDIENNSRKYYNKCAQYLLEKVGWFLKNKGLNDNDLTMYFEKGNFDYAALRNLISACQDRPLHPETKFLRYIDPYKILTSEKGEKPLLCLADLVAHALYKCVDKNERNYHIPEPRYFKEIRSRFIKSPNTNRIEGFGLKLIHNLADLDLDAEIRSEFDS